MRILRRIIILGFAFLIASACNKRPEGVLSDKEMVGLIADMEVAESYLQTHNHSYYNDSTRDKVLQYILDRHGLDKAGFDSTMVWYGRNIDEYRNLLSKVDKELQHRAKSVKGSSLEEIVKSDLWPYSRHYMMSALSENNLLQFSIPGSDITSGDRLSWEMRVNSLLEGMALMGVEYENGIKAYTYASTGGTRKMSLSLQTDTSQTIKRVFGQVKVNELSLQPIFIDSVSLKSLPFDSLEYYKINSQRIYRGPINLQKARAERDSVEEDASKNNNDQLPPPSPAAVHSNHKRLREIHDNSVPSKGSKLQKVDENVKLQPVKISK